MDRITRLDSLETDIQPIIVMLGTPAEDAVQSESVPRAVENVDGASAETPDFYGLALLQHIATELRDATLSKLVVPISMFHTCENDSIFSQTSSSSRSSRLSSRGVNLHNAKPSSPGRVPGKYAAVDRHRTLKCVDSGATDVLTSPLHEDRLRGLGVHGYRAHLEMLKDRAKFVAQNKARKQSWLGSTDTKKYGYLREAMYVLLRSPMHMFLH